MQGLKIGHVTHHDKGTGVSVFLFEPHAVGSYVICGSGPASHELAPLDPEMSVPSLHGLMFAGGSAFGLHAVAGVMQYLVEQGVGLTLPHGVVPIVPAACVYDLVYKAAHFPDAQDGYHACLNASVDNHASGQVGAGTGATVGKLIPNAKRMTSGMGRAVLTTPDGVEVVAYAVVNAVGDIYDKKGIIAGASFADGTFANCEKFLLSGEHNDLYPTRAHTTLTAIFTNAKFSKAELKRIAKMSIAGLARAISPVFTCYDGDIAFAISLGEKIAPAVVIGTMAAEAVRLSILNAVQEAAIIV